MFFVAGGGIFTAEEDVFGGEAAGRGVDGGGFGFSETRGVVGEDPAWGGKVKFDLDGCERVVGVVYLLLHRRRYNRVLGGSERVLWVVIVVGGMTFWCEEGW